MNDGYVPSFPQVGHINGAAVLLAIIIALYLFPFLIALMRGKNPGGVFIVNLVLGWSIVGWCIALGMACGQVPVHVHARRSRPSRMTAREFIDESRDLWRESRRS